MTDGQGAWAEIHLGRAPGSVAAARRWLASLDGMDPSTLERAQLAISELVTNAVRHGAGDSVTVRMQLDGDCMHVEVVDAGGGFDHRDIDTTPTHHAEGGRGLMIVSRITDRWGADGSRVWFEMHL